MTRGVSKFSIGLFLVGGAHPTILAPILAIVLSAGAAGQVLTGSFRWTDNQGATHPTRQHLVDVYVEDGSEHLDRTYTDLNGMFTATYFAPPPPGMYSGVFGHVYADTGGTPGAGGGLVFPQGMRPGMRPPPMVYSPTRSEPTYHAGSGVPGNGGVISVTFPRPGFTGDPLLARALSVSDALYTGWYYSSQVRAAGAVELPVNFPTTVGTSQYGAPARPGEMDLLERDAFDWDVILHEYGHHLANLDNLSSLLPLGHQGGMSSIPVRGKPTGTRLAWQEGLATYIGVAAQHVNPVAQNLPGTMGNPIMTNVGDTRYADTEDQLVDFDLEGLEFQGVANRGQGEGDELPISRILWDLADGTGATEIYDRINIGHVPLYRVLNNTIAFVDQIEDVWDHYFGISSDALRKDYGAIFEEHGISPHPVGDSPISERLPPSAPPPNFDWERRNNDANDIFQLIVFDENLSERVLDIAVPGDATTYTLTNSEWNTLRNRRGDFRFVIAGSDTTDFTTGAYWSDAYPFSVIPEPGAISLASCALVLGMLHRRRSISALSAQQISIPTLGAAD